VIIVEVAPKLPVPVALAYWIDQPERETVVELRLKSSTKSLEYGAPVLPPPPYTWLTTTSGETAGTACDCEAPPTRTTTSDARATTTKPRTRGTASPPSPIRLSESLPRRR
jgi:hypothetical protein